MLRPRQTSKTVAATATVALALVALASPRQARADAPKKLPNGVAIAPCGKAPKDMGCIPGGAFLRGTDSKKLQRAARPQATVHLQTFFMDKYEVTVAAYKACVKAGKCKRAKTWYKDYSRPRQPKVGVSWYHAVAFCKAQGKHLPTEAQWEKAARGTDGRLYPWGNETATCKEAVIKDRRGRSCGVKKLVGKHPEKGRTFVVGTRKPNQYGLYDMAGNSWEWVADWFAWTYKACGKACLGVDPKGPCNGRSKCRGYRYKIVRGGSWYWPAKYSSTIWRRPHFPKNSPYHHFGFRCAASVEEARKLVAAGK